MRGSLARGFGEGSLIEGTAEARGRRRRPVILLALGVGLLAAGCGGEPPVPGTTPAASPAPRPERQAAGKTASRAGLGQLPDEVAPLTGSRLDEIDEPAAARRPAGRAGPRSGSPRSPASRGSTSSTSRA